MLCGQAASGPDLRLVTGRQFDGKPRPHKPGLPRRNSYRRHGVQIHARIFLGAMRIARNNGFRPQPADSNRQVDIIAV